MSLLEDVMDEHFPEEFARMSYELEIQNFKQGERTDDRGRLLPRELNEGESGVVQGRIRFTRLPTFRSGEAGQEIGYDAQVKVPDDIEYPLYASDDDRVDHATEIWDPRDGKQYRVLDYRSEHNSLLSIDVTELAGTRDRME